MKATAATLLCVSLALAGTTASAQDATKKDATDKDSGSSMLMTVQQCKEHMAASAKSGMKKDDAMLRKDTMCNDLMKKEGPRVTGDAPANGQRNRRTVAAGHLGSACMRGQRQGPFSYRMLPMVRRRRRATVHESEATHLISGLARPGQGLGLRDEDRATLHQHGAGPFDALSIDGFVSLRGS